MDKFHQISTELLLLIYVENWFWCFMLSIIRSIFFKLCMWVDIMKECYWIAYHLMLSRKYRVMALNLKYDEILYTRSRSTQLHQSFHLSYGPWFMDRLCIENISWRGMMHACSAFIEILNFHPWSQYWVKEKMSSVYSRQGCPQFLKIPTYF